MRNSTRTWWNSELYFFCPQIYAWMNYLQPTFFPFHESFLNIHGHLNEYLAWLQLEITVSFGHLKPSFSSPLVFLYLPHGMTPMSLSLTPRKYSEPNKTPATQTHASRKYLSEHPHLERPQQKQKQKQSGTLCEGSSSFSEWLKELFCVPLG